MESPVELFTCPQCSCHRFRTTYKRGKDGLTRTAYVTCHDDFRIGCAWYGKRTEAGLSEDLPFSSELSTAAGS